MFSYCSTKNSQVLLYKMVIKHHVVGYENFCEFLKTFDTKDKLVHMIFTGSKNSEGESWCSDCNDAWPTIEKELANLPENSHFVMVEVGDREEWKDPNNPFRKDPKIKLLVVPTLIRWNCPQKLVGEQCENPELLHMIFTFDEDD